MSEMVPIVITLATVIVTLAGAIVWAVRFLANRLADAFDGLKSEIHANTNALKEMKTEQSETNTMIHAFITTQNG